MDDLYNKIVARQIAMGAKGDETLARNRESAMLWVPVLVGSIICLVGWYFMLEGIGALFNWLVHG